MILKIDFLFFCKRLPVICSSVSVTNINFIAKSKDHWSLMKQTIWAVFRLESINMHRVSCHKFGATPVNNLLICPKSSQKNRIGPEIQVNFSFETQRCILQESLTLKNMKIKKRKNLYYQFKFIVHYFSFYHFLVMFELD